MDSGNSGSLQSSSGEDEFDSRADAISAATAAVVAAMMNNPRGGGPSPPLSSAMFDPLSSSSFFDPISRPPPQQQQQLPFHHHNNSNSVLNLDMAAWSKTLRSDPNCTEIINNNSSSFQSLFTHQNHDLQNPLPPPSTTTPLPAAAVPPENSTTTNTTGRADHQPQPQPHGQRNPKKRSRASRRAPTTVLTTDTTNFRAMVQEFTGIPAPPFTASSSPFPRARGLLDLYGTPSTIRSSNHHYSLDNSSISTSINTNTVSTPSYLRRPFPQKVQLPPPPFLSAGASTPSSSSSPLINYQLSSSPPQSSSSLFNVPNQILTSLLQSNNNPSKSSLPFLDDFGLGHGSSGGSVNPNPNPTTTTVTATSTTTTTTLSGLPGLISPDQTVPRNSSINDNVPPAPPIINWGNGIGSSIHDENDHNECHHQAVRGNNASSDNAAPAAGGGGGGRGEGMMESWICSSD